MGKTYRRARTVNKVRKSRAVERTQKEAARILSNEEMLEFIDCCREILGGRSEDDEQC